MLFRFPSLQRVRPVRRGFALVSRYHRERRQYVQRKEARFNTFPENFSRISPLFPGPQKLCFERFELTDDNMSVLCATIHKFKALSFVDCKLGAAHCEKLAAYIKSHNDSLISLDLTSNPVEQEGAVFLGGAIAGSSIEILDLSRTSIGAKGVIAMLKLMTGKTKIKIFRLDFVKLGPTGAKAVSDFLVGSHVEEISLASTGIPDHQWNLLKKGFDGAKKLKKVIVGKTEEKMSSAREMIAKYQ